MEGTDFKEDLQESKKDTEETETEKQGAAEGGAQDRQRRVSIAKTFPRKATRIILVNLPREASEGNTAEP